MTTQTVKIELQVRDLLGKKVKQLRRLGIIPVHLYGPDTDSRSLQCEQREILRALASSGGTTPITVSIEGESGEQLTFAREVQWHPVRGDILHVDFLAVTVNQTVASQVPLILTGESAGARQAGGTVVLQMREITVEALPLEIPSEIEINKLNLSLGKQDHYSAAFGGLNCFKFFDNEKKDSVSTYRNSNKNIYISNSATVMDGVNIGNFSSINANCFIGSNVKIGSNVIIEPNVVITHSIIGDNVTIKSGCVIGPSGFGYLRDGDKSFHIPQLGRVIIENNIEIGANCAIARGSLKDTFIGSGTIIKQSVNIGENCFINMGKKIFKDIEKGTTIK